MKTPNGMVELVIGIIWVAANVAFVLWRFWAGGMFDTGLERLFGWTPGWTASTKK